MFTFFLFHNKFLVNSSLYSVVFAGFSAQALNSRIMDGKHFMVVGTLAYYVHCL